MATPNQPSKSRSDDRENRITQRHDVSVKNLVSGRSRYSGTKHSKHQIQKPLCHRSKQPRRRNTRLQGGGKTPNNASSQLKSTYSRSACFRHLLGILVISVSTPQYLF